MRISITWGEMSSIAYRRPTVLGYPILCVPLVISIRLKWEYPKWSCSLYLLSIPSHPIPSCTPLYQGQNGNIPNCTTPHACIPTVHPIPMYHGKEGTEWEHPKLYHPLCLHPYCPSHPNVPWEGRDGVGTSQTVPPLMSASLLSIPSQCTMGRKGWSGNIPNCTTPYACIPTVHPIPMYHGKEGTEWEHPKLYHPPSASLLSIPSQCTMGRKGWSRNIPKCTTSHVCIPTAKNTEGSERAKKPRTERPLAQECGG